MENITIELVVIVLIGFITLLLIVRSFIKGAKNNKDCQSGCGSCNKCDNLEYKKKNCENKIPGSDDNMDMKE